MMDLHAFQEEHDMGKLSYCRAAAVVAVLVSGAVARVQAEERAVLNDMFTNVYPAFGTTAGWEFSLTQPVSVTHLGVWDYYRNGLGQAHSVSIWTASGGSPLVTGTVPAGGASGSYWYWVELASPTLLGTGDYVIGAYFATGTDALLGYQQVGSGPPPTTGPGVTYVESRYCAGNAFPTETTSWEKGYFGPNFRYDPNPIPEPALVQLPFLLGLGGVGVWWRRRRAS